MSPSKSLIALRALAVMTALTLPLGGCAYDYLQHTDRVGYSAGDAVNANLEAETVNPSSAAQYDTSGLGADGNVTPDQMRP